MPQQRRSLFATFAVIFMIVSSTLFALGFVLVASSLFGRNRVSIPSRGVLHIKLDGPLVEHAEIKLSHLLGEPKPTTLRSVTDSIRRAGNDKRIVGVLIDIGSPELGVAQLQELEDAMAQFRASGKWTEAFMETAGDGSRGTGAYAAAILADKVILAPPGDVNLVGIEAESMFFAGTFEKLDIKVHFEQRYEYKNAANQFTEKAFTPAHRESLKALVDDLQADVVHHIAARRKVDEAQARAWISGGPYLAPQALEHKLVDRLAYWDEVQKEVDDLTGDRDRLIELQHYWEDGRLHDSGPAIGLIEVSGAIVRGESPSGVARDNVGSDTISRGLREARDAKVKGVLLRIDSPGGSYIASDVARREVEVTRNAGIPVVVSMGSVAASGGYFIAMDSDYIVAEPSTITGSIGVYAGGFAVREALNKWLGITVDAYRTMPNANVFSQTTPFTPERIAVMKAGADRVYQDFVSKVAARRNKDFAAIDAVAKGRVWSGKAALERGLVDELGSAELALKRLRERVGLADTAQVTLTEYPESKGAWEVIRQMLTGGTAADLTALRQGPWRDAVDAYEESRALFETTGAVMAMPVGVRIH